MPNYNARNTMRPTHVMERLNRKTEIDPITGCWLFMGSLDNRGYGQIYVISGLKPEKVHRISAHFFLDFDLNDSSHQINHKQECPNKHCWNPEHIYIGSQQENVLDSMIKNTHSNQFGIC